MARTVSIVPHTHWDREWYAPFQQFRLDLVDLVDDLLRRLDDDPSFRHFQLDGQVAAVDDYLELRPEQAATITRLNRTGRLALGPWYTLPDEFLVSGETLVRNLRLGMDRAADLGGAMAVGYLPDMFGHVAQMPQLLRSFGLDHAVVWRGVPAAVDRSAFDWVAPDGTSIRAEYLPQGYGNGARLPEDAKELVDLIDGFVEDHGDLLVGPVLWMNGADHVRPSPWLGAVVTEANQVQDDYELVIRSLAEHLAAGPTEELPRWTGELRSGARANLLMGVGSNRVDVKAAAARAERTLERVAEPLYALFRPPDDWPQRALDIAWRAVVLNSAHDSICACSADAVVDAVVHRYAEATQIGAGLTERALRAIGDRAGTRGALVVNPAPTTRSGVVELRLPGTGPAPGVQVLEESPARSVVHEVTAADAPTIVERELDIRPQMTSLTIEDEPGAAATVVTLHVEELPRPAPPPEGRRVVASLRRLAASAPQRPVRIELQQPPSRRVLAATGPVPGFGWVSWRPPSEAPPVGAEPRDDGAVLTGRGITVHVDRRTGTWSIDELAALGRIVDDGDDGDTYNYSPPAADLVVDQPAAVAVEVLEAGPLRAAVEIRAEHRWPERTSAGARVGEVDHSVRTRLELRSGERFVRVTTRFTNRSRDHRVRAWFPLPRPSRSSTAESAFGVVERGLTAEGGPTELGVPTFPSRRFVQAGGLTLVHDGLLEYELVEVDDGPDGPVAGALALTLLRATGMLSQGPMTTRPLPAGPLDPLEGPQMQGPVTARYAVAVGRVDPFELADHVLLPLLVADGAGRRDGPTEEAGLTVDGAVVSAVERRGGALHVRVFNPDAEPTVVTVRGRRGWTLDLAERPLEPFESSLELRGNGIVTLALDERQS